MVVPDGPYYTVDCNMFSILNHFQGVPKLYGKLYITLYVNTVMLIQCKM